MNARLEQYIEEMATAMRGMSEETRQSELTEIRQHLQSLIAEQEEQRRDTVEATNAALQQFGTAREVGEMLNPTSLRRRLQALPENAVTVLYCLAMFAVAAIGMRFTIGPLLYLLLPVQAPHGGMIQVFNLKYGLLLEIAALYLVLKRDGLPLAFRNVFLPGSAIGAAARWILLFRLTTAVVSTAIFHFYDLRRASEIMLSVGFLIPLLTGWIVGRTAPRHAVKGVIMAMTTLIGIGTINNLLSHPFLYDRVFFSSFGVSSLLTTLGSVALAYGGVLAGRWQAARG